MQSHERIEKQAAALEWTLSNAVHGYLDRQGYPTYDIQDIDGIERSVSPDEYIKPTLDACVRDGKLNGADFKALSPHPPMDPTKEAVLDAKVACLEHTLDALNAHVDSLQYVSQECNAYQNMMIRLVVMGASSEFEEKEHRREFIRNCGDLLIHWSKGRNK